MKTEKASVDFSGRKMVWWAWTILAHKTSSLSVPVATRQGARRPVLLPSLQKEWATQDGCWYTACNEECPVPDCNRSYTVNTRGLTCCMQTECPYCWEERLLYHWHSSQFKGAVWIYSSYSLRLPKMCHQTHVLFGLIHLLCCNSWYTFEVLDHKCHWAVL